MPLDRTHDKASSLATSSSMGGLAKKGPAEKASKYLRTQLRVFGQSRQHDCGLSLYVRVDNVCIDSGVLHNPAMLVAIVMNRRGRNAMTLHTRHFSRAEAHLSPAWTSMLLSMP